MRYLLATHRRARAKWWPVLLGLVVVALGCGGAILLHSRATRAPIAASPHTAVVKKVNNSAVSSNMLFVGDVFWGRTVQTKAEASKLRYQYPTSGLDRSDRNAYDAWIGNFECPITMSSMPLSAQIRSLTFNCRPEYLPNLASWFTAGSQANNHTMNENGQSGIMQTRQNLDAQGLQYFGNYDMTKLNDICEVIAMPARVLGTDRHISMPVALCGYMQVVDTVPSVAQLDVMKAYAKVMPVIAMPHMGIEYRTTAEPAKVNTYHAMIDSGADAVIGAHPHVIQNSESYHGHLIAYSLGNFLFDQQSVSRDTTLGLAVGINLTVHDSKAAAIYQQVAPSCKTYQDTCLVTLQGRLSQRPAISVDYSFSCFDESTKVGSVPHKGSDEVCNEAKQRATVDHLQDLSHQW